MAETILFFRINYGIYPIICPAFLQPEIRSGNNILFRIGMRSDTIRLFSARQLIISNPGVGIFPFRHEDMMSMQIQSHNPVGPESIELQKRSGLAVRVKSDQKTRPSEEVDNPLGRDKIELSKNSLAEELSLLKQKQEKKKQKQEILSGI